MALNFTQVLDEIISLLKRGEEKLKTTLTKPKKPAKGKAPSPAETAKRRSRGKIFLVIGIISILIGFFTFFIPWLWGIPLTIVGGIILKKELKKLASFLKPYFSRASSLGPALLNIGVIFIILAVIFLFLVPRLGLGFLNWGILFIILGIPLTVANLVLRHHVMGDWGHFVEGAQGKAEEIFKGTEDFLKESGVSSINVQRRELIPGIIKGMLGRKREFLVLKEEHFKLKPYQLLVNARDYGNNLDVVWYLTYRLSLIPAFLSILPFVSFIPAKLQDLDLFDVQDLKAYNTVCHRAVLKAVEKLVRSLDQDVSKIDRSTRGFLGIS